MTDDGRWVCCDGGVEGGCCGTERGLLAAGDRDGELARYSSRSAPVRLEAPFLTCWTGGGVRGSDGEMMLLETG